MFFLAVRSVRQRPGRLLATLLSAFLGALIVMTFGSLHDTAAAPGVDAVSSESLSVSASVVGGYGALLVFFAIASTLTVNVRQRAEEMSLLRRTGATPAQIGRMVVGEATAVALAATVLATGPAVLGGRLLLGLFQDSGQVAGDVRPAFGVLALASGFGIVLLASAGAAFLAVRRATRAAGADGRTRGRDRARALAGAAAVAAGIGGVLATYAMDGTEQTLMAFPAYGAVLLSVGLAVLAPAALGRLLKPSRGPLDRIAGAGGYLAARNLRSRGGELSGVLTPMIVFVGMATATLYIQAVESDWIAATGQAKTVGDKNLETVNLVVVGVIVVFSCVMLVNSLYAATSYRRGEFGRQRLAGATPAQVLGTVGCEAVILVLTGLVLGSAAGVAGVIPFTMVRTGQVLPGEGPGTWLAVAAVAVAATLGTTLTTARRALRAPAVDAVAVAA
ncbi:ABC transporter permease [Streptomyces nitrosporeus]|uniref:ABC transporter permease n=1 Tax=Streptomyces nitrosporeus TaxID=28894 RepID=A0A5J6FAN3_9ACTN|nr:FtsX-like permease family protein [Streptomyces nitrosporeus]QEU73063.1 ABC transporter permease [Streptomyces nitrosporeus]GGZ17557.1 transporter [Streptomyces nitrosporeus]